MKIGFFHLETWAKEIVQNSQLVKENECIFFDNILTEDNIPKESDFEIISVFVDCKVTKSVLDSMPELKLITTRSTGYDHIDLEECKKRNIIVSSVPAYGENTVAEFTFALLLALSRKIFDGIHQIKQGVDYNVTNLQGFDLKGKTLGVIGTGRIGKHVIRIAKGFEMNILACDGHEDKYFAQELNFSYLPLEEVLAKSDIVTLHVPYMPETHHLINKSNIKNIKKGAYIINTSRGGVIETEALLEALKDNHIAGAGLDVLEEEGALKDELHFLASGGADLNTMKTVLSNHALIDMPNVIVTPHNAFNTKEALERILQTTLQNIQGYLDGKPENIVNV